MCTICKCNWNPEDIVESSVTGIADVRKLLDLSGRN